MSKRTDTIRSMFTTPPADLLSEDNAHVTRPKVSPGSVRSMKDSLTGIERENDELRHALAGGAAVVEIDPALLDPSPFRDRFADTDPASLNVLKSSIATKGQQVPILVRPHPSVQERYQIAYGHRRVQVLRELSCSVKAVIRQLSDTDLAVAQGVENSARQDLSFIERAVFAMHLEDSGHDRSVVQEALSIDRAETSKLISVAQSIPEDLISAIGRAPKIGRGRWQSLADAAKIQGSIQRMHAAIKAADFAGKDSDARFVTFLAVASAEVGNRKEKRWAISTPSGYQVARVMQSENELKVLLDRKANPEFATFLIDQLLSLFDLHQRTSSSDHREE